MGIKDKATYGDYYWASQVEANQFFADESEKVVSPYISGLLADIPNFDLMPKGIQKMLRAVEAPSSFAFLPFAAGIGINMIDEVLDAAFESSILALTRANRARTLSTWLKADEVNTLRSREKITEALWKQVISSEGYEPILGTSLYESQLPYPSIPDITSNAHEKANL